MLRDINNKEKNRPFNITEKIKNMFFKIIKTVLAFFLKIKSFIFSIYKNKIYELLEKNKYSLKNLKSKITKPFYKNIKLFPNFLMFLLQSVKTFFLEIVFLSFFVLTSCYIFVSLYSAEYIYSKVSDIPKKNVALVLGTSKYMSDGKHNLYYLYRIKAANELYKKGKVDYILVSGDNRRNNYNEPKQMYLDLVYLGVPKDKIYLDFAGFRTYDSIVRAKEVFDQNDFIVVSQKFHNERAIFIGRVKGINILGYNAKNVRKLYRIKQFPRELTSRIIMIADLLTGKHPRFYGDKIYIGIDNQQKND